MIRLQKLFPSREPASPPPLTELEKLPTITNYQQASTTLSPTPKVEGKTFANFANFNFCLTFNFLRVQPGRSRGLGSPRNNTEHREPKKYYSTVAGASRFRNLVEQQDIYHEKSSIFWWFVKIVIWTIFSLFQTISKSNFFATSDHFPRQKFFGQKSPPSV